MSTISVEKDFSRYPGGRYKTDGPYSGEQFRDEILIPALQRSREPIELDFAGVLGAPTSWLEEVFGGLIRKGVPWEEFEGRVLLRNLSIERQMTAMVCASDEDLRQKGEI